MVEDVILTGRFRVVRQGNHRELELEGDDESLMILIHPGRDGIEAGDIWWVLEPPQALPKAS